MCVYRPFLDGDLATEDALIKFSTLTIHILLQLRVSALPMLYLLFCVWVSTKHLLIHILNFLNPWVTVSTSWSDFQQVEFTYDHEIIAVKMHAVQIALYGLQW